MAILGFKAHSFLTLAHFLRLIALESIFERSLFL